MLGKIIKYDDINEIGYINGYDEITYFYHQNNVKNNIKFNIGDIVSFEYILNMGEEKMPYAVNIIKEEIKKDIIEKNNNNGKSKAYKELYEIINCLPKEKKEKISKGFLNEIEINMDNSYTYKIEHLEDFENQPMLDETKNLLAIVYRDYLTSPEERQNILQKEKRESEEKELEKRRMYNPDVFAQKREQITYINNIHSENNQEYENKSLMVKQEYSWFTRFIKFIKGIFKRY